MLDYGPCDPAVHPVSWRAVNSVKIDSLACHRHRNVHSGLRLAVGGGAELVQGARDSGSRTQHWHTATP